MAARKLEHYNIRTTRLEPTIRFYTEVLGLRSGYRPTQRPGAWIYDERDVAVVHISGVDPNDAQSLKELEAHLGKRDLASLNGSGAIDHVAFEADDYDGFRDHLGKCGVEFFERDVPAMKLRQIFVKDPNGIMVELNFHG